MPPLHLPDGPKGHGVPQLLLFAILAMLVWGKGGVENEAKALEVSLHRRKKTRDAPNQHL